ncbi:hypothetical protein [Neorhizobium sp. T7_12]|uniref:hypothetical protein n=1 Tax=Neorhizobium sp. T7_12 TaxID=2093832 RepID=UPI000CF8E1E2|nr:hypothetical protein [Neorhizobium sp. T7_12]
MAAINQRMTHQPIPRSGLNILQRAASAIIEMPHITAVSSWPVVSGASIKSTSKVHTQDLIIQHRSWAELNLANTIATIGKPSSNEIRAAEEALERLQGRRGENVEEWSVKLAEKYSSSGD